MVVRIRREKYIFIRFGRFTLPNSDGWDQTAMEQRFKCLRLPIYRSVILLEFSPTWSCVSLTRPTTSSEWKLFRFDKMEVNSFSNIAEWCHVLSLTCLQVGIQCANIKLKKNRMYNRNRRKSSLQIGRPCDHIYIQSSGVLQGIVHVNEIMQGLRRGSGVKSNVQHMISTIYKPVAHMFNVLPVYIVIYTWPVLKRYKMASGSLNSHHNKAS